MASLRLVWFRLGASSTSFAPELAVFRARAGVYVIRSRRTGKVVYVGSCRSTKQGLAETVRRHDEKMIRKQDKAPPHKVRTLPYAKRYGRMSHDVAIVATSPGKALWLERRLRLVLVPRDNPLKESPF